MAKFTQFWVSNQQQFGFKRGHGCDICTCVVKEAAKRFLENGHDVVFGCCLDLSMAYDILSHPLLITKLLLQSRLSATFSPRLFLRCG